MKEGNGYDQWLASGHKLPWPSPEVSAALMNKGPGR
jgi:hypothetical protein